MNKTTSQTSSEATSQESSNKTDRLGKAKSDRFIQWSKVWWPVLLLVVILGMAGFTKYISPDELLYNIVSDLIKAIGLLMVVMYVIYTRLLAIETKNMTEVSKGLYSSEKGTVFGEAIISVWSYEKLPEDVKKITQTIHLKDKKLTEDEFQRLIKDEDLPAISIKIKNFCARRIEARIVRYKVRHTGSRTYHNVDCDISQFGKLMPWEDKTIGLIVAPEGEVEVIINSIIYIDGDVEKLAKIASNQLPLERIRKPEKTSND